MRAKYLWPCVAICVAAVAGRAVGQSGVRWAPNMEMARKIAAQTNRPILVHFWSESCGPCMRMEREVFSRPDVAAAIEANFVAVRVNVLYDSQLVRQYGVDRWPTDLILSPQGAVLERRSGFLDATQYIGAMNQIAVRVRGASPQQAYAQGMSGSAYGSPGMVGQAAARATVGQPYQPPGYGQPTPSYQSQGGIANQRSTGFSGTYRPDSAGIRQSNPNVNPYPPRGRAGDPPVQSWPAETARWNPGGEPTRRQPSPASRILPAAEPRRSNPPLGLDGYCPVTLVEKECWVKGDPRYGVIHRDRTYLFCGPEEAKRFFTDPDRYAPVLSGMDVVLAVDENRQVPGRREYGAWYPRDGGRVYLFASDASLSKFEADPARYAAAATQAGGVTARLPAGPREPPLGSSNRGYSPYVPPARY